MGAHDVFHISHPKHYVCDEKNILDYLVLESGPNLSYPEHPVDIINRMEKTQKN